MSSPVSQKTTQEMPLGRINKANSTGSRIKVSTPQVTQKADQMKDAIPTSSQGGSNSAKLKTHSHAPTGIEFHQLKLTQGKRAFGHDRKDQ